MNIKYICIYIVLSVVCHSCKPKPTNNSEYTELSVNLVSNAIKISSIVSEIKPIFLETNDESLIGMMPNIQFTKELIFIESDNTLKIFDYEGKFVSNFNHIGSGPGEYSSISDFYIDEHSNIIEILDKRQKKVLSYNFTGEYVKDFDLNFWPLKITKTPSRELLVYSGYERDDDNIHKFNLFDMDNRSQFSEIDVKKSKFLHISNKNNFYNTKDGETLFFEPFNDTIFTVNHLGANPKYTLSFDKGSSNIPASFYNKNQFSNVFEFFQEFNKHSYVNSTYNVMETRENLILSCYYKGNKYLVLHDKLNESTTSYNRIIEDFFTDDAIFPFGSEGFTFFANSDIVMFLISPSWFIENENKIIKTKYYDKLKMICEEDNPILVVSKLR